MRNNPHLDVAAPVPGNRLDRKQRGFSLIELVMVIVILGIISTVGAKLMGTGFQLYFTGRDSLVVDSQARVALERMTRELRTVRPATGLTMAANEVTFNDVDGTSVRYCMGTVGTCPGAAGQLMRNAQVLAGGVSALSFVYTNANGVVTAVAAQVYYISVQFTVTQGGIARDYRATISPRNS